MTVALAGHVAVGSFVIGGAIAMVTAHSFAALSARAGRSGGLFVYLHNAGYPRAGSYISWLLMFGYLIALAVYGFTFGHYAAGQRHSDEQQGGPVVEDELDHQDDQREAPPSPGHPRTPKRAECDCR